MGPPSRYHIHDNKTQLVEKGGSSFFEKGVQLLKGGGVYDFLFLMGVTMRLNWWIPPGNF